MPESENCTISEWVRATIGLFIVFFILILLTLIYWYRNIEDFKTISATLIGLVTTIVGFYFGVKGTDDANKRADKANQGMTQALTLATKGGGIATDFLIISKTLPQPLSQVDNQELQMLQSRCESFVKEVKQTGMLINTTLFRNIDSEKGK
jgi:hypothetical protein